MLSACNVANVAAVLDVLETRAVPSDENDMESFHMDEYIVKLKLSANGLINPVFTVNLSRLTVISF